MRTRFRQGEWCLNCNKEPTGSLHLGGDLKVFAVLRDKWVEVKKVWYNPNTWFGGYWECIGMKSRF